MKKVLFLITCMTTGGAEKVLIDLVNSLDKYKYDITVMLVYKKSIYDKNTINFNKYFNNNIRVKYICNNDFELLYRIFNISLNRINNKIIHKIFIGNKYDIEVAFSEGLPTKIISNSNNKKSNKIAWLHTDSKNRTRNMNSNLLNDEKYMYSKFDKLVAVSSSVCKSFQDLYGTFNNINVKYNPIDTNKIINKAKEVVDIEFDYNIKFVAVGRLTEVKGYERLIQVVRKLKDEKFEFRLFIIGDGELKSKLENMIEEYNLLDSVILLGLQENPYKYLSKCDVFVCSSFIEGLSTVVLEAISINIPVITTNCNGMREIFGGYECGIICENSSQGLYGALKNILLEPNLIDKYSNNCKYRANQFSIDRAIKEIEKIL